MAGVRQRKKSWQIWWIDSSSKKRMYATLKKHSYPNKSDAKREANRREIEENRESIVKDILFINYAYAWLKDKNCEKSTLQRYRASIENFYTFLSGVEQGILVKKVTQAMIKRFIESRRQEGYSNSGINSDLRTIKQIFKSAVTDGYIKESPMKEIGFLREERKAKELPSKEEVVQILRWFKKNAPLYYPWIYFEATRGWRRDELRHMKVSDIDFQARNLYVLKTKTKHQRIAELTKDDCFVLSSHVSLLKRKNLYSEDGILFPSRKGKMLSKNRVLCQLKRAIRDLNIKKNITNHSFRRYVVTSIANKTNNFEVIKSITGHKDTRTIIDHYLVATPELVRQGLNITRVKV